MEVSLKKRVEGGTERETEEKKQGKVWKRGEEEELIS